MSDAPAPLIAETAPHPRRLAVAKQEIRDADLLLFRGVGPIGRLIAWQGRSPYSHAAMAAWWDGELMALELREFRGGRAVTLASQVLAHPGRIDVYRPDPPDNAAFEPTAAVQFMRRYCGREYSYGGVLRLAAMRVPGLHKWFRPSFSDACSVDLLPAFCSQGVSAAYCAAGWDPVHNLASRCTEPGDLARAEFRYLFTLEG